MAFPPVPFQEWFLRQTSTGNAALNAYVARVKADGGVVEAIGCVPLAVWDWAAPSFVGLLDLYPNAAAAYSLRKLRAAYSGSAVRVRKEVSLVSSETDIGFLADGSLDTTSLLAFASDADSGDVFVVTWYDQSLSNDATQSTAADQPKIVSGGSLVTEGSKPAIEFDGTDDYFSLSSPVTFTNDFFMSMVLNADPQSTFNVLLNNVSSTGDRIRIYNDGDLEIRISATNYSYSSALVLNSQELITIQRDLSNNLDVFVDGVSKGTNVNSSIWSGILGLIGSNQSQASTQFFTGNIQTMIFWDSAQNRAAIESNQATFYGITI